MTVQHAARWQVQSTARLGVQSWCRERHIEIPRHETLHFEIDAAAAGRNIATPPYRPEKT
jgi:hypothetical protein